MSNSKEEIMEAEEKDGSSAAIGIDFGTSYCRVAFWDKRVGRAEVIPNDRGSTSTPSYVSFNADDGEFVVGDAAKETAQFNPTTIFNVKRLIGRDYHDDFVQREIKQLPFKVCAGGDGRVWVPICHGGRQERYPTLKIASLILMMLKSTAEKHLGRKVQHAVIAVPTSFDTFQRQAIIDAGRAAGLNVQKVISESSAAAIAHGREDQHPRIALVFDIGGGFVDVTLLSIKGSSFEVKATAGDSFGGEDFTHIMIRHFLGEIKTKHWKDISGKPKALARLRLACEEAKEVLCVRDDAAVQIDNLDDNVDFSMLITRDTFNELNAHLYAKCKKLVQNCLEEAKVDKLTVDEILLLGNATKIPKFQELLCTFFDGKKNCVHMDPGAVARGASIQAAFLKPEDLYLVDRSIKSFGMHWFGGIMDVCISRNTPIPVRKKIELTTSNDYQTTLRIMIYEGEAMHTDNCNLLGLLRFQDFFPDLKGIHEINLWFEIDDNGILKIWVEDQLTKKHRILHLTNNKGKLNEKIRIAELKANREPPLVPDAQTKVWKGNLERYCSRLRYFINSETYASKLWPSDKMNIEDAIEKALKWVTHCEGATYDEYLAKREEIEKIILEADKRPLYCDEGTMQNGETIKKLEAEVSEYDMMTAMKIEKFCVSIGTLLNFFCCGKFLCCWWRR